MAITIHSIPEEFQPVYNPYVIVMSSDNSTAFNFKISVIIFDATDIDNPAKLIGSFKYPTDVNGYVKVDLTRIVRDYLTDDFELGLSLAADCPNSIRRLYVVAQEFYSASATTAPTGQGDIYTVLDPLSETAGRFVWNGALPFDTFADYTKDNYILKHSNYSSNKYLTSANLTKGLNMAVNQNGYIHVLLENLNEFNIPIALAEYIKIKAYDNYNDLTGTWNVSLGYTTLFNTLTGYHIRIPIGTYNISQIGSLDLISGSLPILTNNVKYYTVQVGSNTYGDGFPIKVNIVDYCNSPEVFRLHWLNRKGGFDSFNFEMYHTQSVNIERKNYKKPYGKVQDGNYSYSSSDKLTTTMLTTSKRTYKIVSNWISEGEAAWLEELMTSPVVYWEKDFETLRGINIVDTAYEVKYHHKDKVFNIELSFELTYDYVSQTY